MNNYHYIISSLPELAMDWVPGENGTLAILDEITESCSDKDRETIDFFRSGLPGDGLNAEFYETAFKHRNRFVREYYAFDLNVRNAKVRYLNKSLGRESWKDVIFIHTGEFPQASRLDAILNGTDILEREKGIDNLVWEKIDELTEFNYFDLDNILAFLAKLAIIERWTVLDDETGREMFRKLVGEVTATYKGIDYK